MRVIGLDLGLSCGYAWTDRGRVVGHSSGEWDLRGLRYEGGGMRFLRFSTLLRELIITAPGYGQELSGVAVFFEIAPPMVSNPIKGKATAFSRELWGGFSAHLMALCEELRVPYAGITVGDIKRAACGKLRASKDEVLVAAARDFEITLKHEEHNRADALWCLSVGLQQISDSTKPIGLGSVKLRAGRARA